MKHALGVLLFLLLHSWTTAQTKINADKLQVLLSENKKIQLVDLRTRGEIENTGKINGAINIDFSAPDFESRITKLDKEKPIVVYCAVGGRSGKTLPLLSKHGFKVIYDYAGGMKDWLSKGLKTVK